VSILEYGVNGVTVRVIRFQFQPEAAVQAAGYLLAHLGRRVDKVKLMKLMYLADRDHFIKHGRPITGDSQWALPHGPVPSCTLNLLNTGDDEEGGSYSAAHIGAIDRQYVLKADPGFTMILGTACEVLNDVLQRYGDKHTWALRDLTHGLPEFLECHVPGSSAPIPYEVILRHYGAQFGRFRHNRPVITPDMATAMLCPFPESEPDL